MGLWERLRKILALWFGFSAPVSRRAYLGTGLALMGFKYLVEALVVHALTGRVWTPADYLVPNLNRFDHLQSVTLSVEAPSTSSTSFLAGTGRRSPTRSSAASTSASCATSRDWPKRRRAVK
jgi:hypothetical protein